jgi:hypothetical protein
MTFEFEGKFGLFREIIEVFHVALQFSSDLIKIVIILLQFLSISVVVVVRTTVVGRKIASHREAIDLIFTII